MVSACDSSTCVSNLLNALLAPMASAMLAAVTLSGASSSAKPSLAPNPYQRLWSPAPGRLRR